MEFLKILQGARGARNWVALLRSPLNLRASVAADNRPRNATQVIVQRTLCRAICICVHAEVGCLIGATEQALTSEPVVVADLR